MVLNVIAGLVLIVVLVGAGLVAYSGGFERAADYAVPAETTAAVQTYGAASSGVLPRELNVLVWNVHKSSDEGWQKDIGRFASASSLLLIQEAFVEPAQAETLFSQTKKLWYFAISFTYAKTGAVTGVALGADAVPRTVVFSRSPGREPWLKTPKTALIGYYSVEGVSELLLVGDIHAHLLTSTADYERQLRLVGEKVKAHHGPAIWGGDFNTWSRRRILLVEEIIKECGLEEIQFDPDKRTRFLGYPLDHLFVRGVDVVSARVEEVRSSDHQALLCVLRIR